MSPVWLDAATAPEYSPRNHSSRTFRRANDMRPMFTNHPSLLLVHSWANRIRCFAKTASNATRSRAAISRATSRSSNKGSPTLARKAFLSAMSNSICGSDIRIM